MRRPLLAALLALLPALAAYGAAGRTTEAARPLRIGLCNINRVFDELEERLDCDAGMRQLQEKRQAALRDLVDKVKNLEEKLKILRPDSDEAKAGMEKLRDTKSEIRAKGRALDEHIFRKLHDFTLSTYKKINAEVRAYAAEAGYDVVIRVRDPQLDSIDPKRSPQARYMELGRRIETHTVLFHRPSLEFTHAIIKRMNQAYAKEKALRREPTPPATPKSDP